VTFDTFGIHHEVVELANVLLSLAIHYCDAMKQARGFYSPSANALQICSSADLVVVGM
jgi:hypothetical protein